MNQPALSFGAILMERLPIEYLPKIFEAERVDRTLDVDQQVAEQTMRELAKQEGKFMNSKT